MVRPSRLSPLTYGRRASGSNHCRTGRASSSPSRPWSGWRCTCGSEDRRRARPCMRRTTITTEGRPSQIAATCRKATLTAAVVRIRCDRRLPGAAVEPDPSLPGRDDLRGEALGLARRPHRLIENTLSAVVEDPVSRVLPADDHVPDRRRRPTPARCPRSPVTRRPDRTGMRAQSAGSRCAATFLPYLHQQHTACHPNWMSLRGY